MCGCSTRGRGATIHGGGSGDACEVGQGLFHSGVSIGLDAFELAPFSQQGGLGQAFALLGEELTRLLEELNLALAA